ncbi:MAG TPA: hypothetical protein VD993_18240 [Chitinophagaceae bacterium]|nr:hypothetical protein [Chitinophagaceae bacterium]
MQLNSILRWTLISSGIVLLAIVALFSYSDIDFGDPIRGDNVADLRADITLIMDNYDYLVTLVISSFGLVTFLIAFQQKMNVTVSPRAWGLLCAAIILLIGAIIFCLFSREFLLLMVTRNAVDLSVPALTLGRWLTYGCMIFAVIMMGFFSLEVLDRSTPKQS